MKSDNYPDEIVALCKSLEAFSGIPVSPTVRIEALGLTSLELLQVVLELNQPRFVEAFPRFFETDATPLSVWNDLDAT